MCVVDILNQLQSTLDRALHTAVVTNNNLGKMTSKKNICCNMFVLIMLISISTSSVDPRACIMNIGCDSNPYEIQDFRFGVRNVSFKNYDHT
jgi:hypothetical protein